MPAPWIHSRAPKDLSVKYPHAQRAFSALFDEARERGAQLCCIVDGRVVVHLAGGRSKEEAFDFDQVTKVFSNSKSIEALVVAILEDRGLLKYTDQVADLMGPEDFKHLKGLTVAGVMRHRGGSSCINKLISIADSERIFRSGELTRKWMLESLARDFDATNPRATAYHAITRGMFVSVIVQRLTGVEYHDFVQKEIVDKIGNKDVKFYLGNAPKSMCAEMEQGRHMRNELFELALHKLGIYSTFFEPSKSAGQEALEKHLWDWRTKGEIDELVQFLTKGSLTQRSFTLFTQPLPFSEITNTTIASIDGVSNAFSLATIFSQAISGKLLSPAALLRALETDGKEEMKAMSLLHKVSFSNAGWCVDFPFGIQGWSGWSGLGGSLCVFNPSAKAVLVYVPTRLFPRSESPNGVRLLRAFIRDLEAGGSGARAKL